MDSLGLRLIKCVIEKKDLLILEKYSLEEFDFFDEAKNAVKYIREYVNDKKEYPTCKMVEEQCKCTFGTEVDTVDYIADEVRKRALAKRIKPVLAELIKKIDERKPDEVLDLMRTSVSSIKKHKRNSPVVSYNKSSSQRYKTYEEGKSTSGLSGIKTPWNFLNEATQGWVNGNLHVLLGMTGLGKTWLECFLVNECKKLGKRVLICSLEMTPERIYSRLDSIRFCLPYSKFRDASLELSVEEKWKKELEILEKEPDSNDVLAVGKEGIKSVSDILSIVEEYKPDIVFVDSAYRLEPTRGSKDTWSSNYSVVKELQIAAEKTDIPWVCSSQLWEEESGSGKRMVVKQTIKYAKEWLIDPDVVIVISQDEDLRLIKQMKVELRKVRDGDGKKVEGHINFDRDVMNFSEVGSASIFDFSAGGVTTDPADIAVSYE